MPSAPIATAKLPTRFGEFILHAFRGPDDAEHLALVRPIHGALPDPPDVRIHSKCLTGDTFASLRCDCRDQLETALSHIATHGGVLIYLDQEGRGIGLINKIKAYALQDQGRDTVEANLQLGFKGDLRDYQAAAQILRSLHLRRVRLLTNNPDKIRSLESFGIEVVERVPLIVGTTPYNKKYIETKKKKLKHLL